MSFPTIGPVSGQLPSSALPTSQPTKAPDGDSLAVEKAQQDAQKLLQKTASAAPFQTGGVNKTV